MAINGKRKSECIQIIFFILKSIHWFKYILLISQQVTNTYSRLHVNFPEKNAILTSTIKQWWSIFLYFVGVKMFIMLILSISDGTTPENTVCIPDIACYKTVTQFGKMKQSYAKVVCGNLGGHIAAFETAEEHANVTALMSDKGRWKQPRNTPL